MRHLVGAFALLLALAGCGSDTSATAACDSDADCYVAPVLVSGTAGRGAEATHATDVTDDAALTAYVAQFDDAFAAKVVQAARKVDVEHGQALLAQVVAIGCDVPPSARVRGETIVPGKVASPMQECLAPVTTVALAAVPA
jgi:hypothetical protein